MSGRFTDLCSGLQAIRAHDFEDPTARFHDLGPTWHTTRVATERKVRNHLAQLTAMGYRVTLEPAA